MQNKELPCSEDTENAVLGCMLSNRESLILCSDILEPDDFFFSTNKIIFENLKKICNQGKPADIHILANILKSQELLDSVGGIIYLTSLCQNYSLANYAEEYCCILKEKKILRDIIKKSENAMSKAFCNPHDGSSLLDDIQRDFCSISYNPNNDSGISIGDIIDGKASNDSKPMMDIILSNVEKYRSNPNNTAITGIPTGFRDLDKMLLGLNNGNLIILSASTSVGKTAFALNIADHVSCTLGIPVGIFSLEMTSGQLVQRMLCSKLNISSQDFLSGNISREVLASLRNSLSDVSKAPIIIDDKGTPKINEIRSKSRRLKAYKGVKMLIVDYLTLIEPSTSRTNDNRQVDVANISRALKLLARELDIPILCLAQLSRKVDDRQSHRPVLGDLRDSGAIEHDADVVLFLYRRDYYDPYDRPGEAEVIVAKNRHGPTGCVKLRYCADTCKYSNI